MTYKIYYHCSGVIDVEADSEAEAQEKFYDLSDQTILWNGFGWEIEDTREC